MTTSKKKKKSARERRVLVASIICAGLIVAGSTFAWFSSSDEVTNRLSASADYNVAIAEDFQPPEDWLPGQTINKDVSAVNTGNVDAFVRMWLGGQMRLLNETTNEDMVEIATSTGINSSNAPSTGLSQTTDKDKLDIGLTWYKAGAAGAAPTYYKTLSKDKISNPNDLAHAGTLNEDTNTPGMFSEVQSVQAGGILVYSPENAAFHWTLEQATELPVYDTATGTPTMTNLAKGTIVGTNASTYTAQSGETFKKITGSANNNYYGAIDASTFQPETEGLYIFRRNVAETGDGTANTYEYSGYYYVPAKAADAQQGTDAVDEQYFALHYDTGSNVHSNYVLPTGVINDNSTAVPSNDQVLPVTINNNKSVYLYTAKEQVIETGTAASNLKWTYNAPNASSTDEMIKNGYFAVKYVGADGTSGSSAGDTDDDIVINISLANIGTAQENWTAILDNATTPSNKTTFYYNNDVEAGDTTQKLVDSVKLSDDTTQKAYLAFDFDLNVFLESVQVTVDENGKEKTIPVNSWAATTTGTPAAAINTGAKPSSGDDAGTYDSTNSAEISVVGWTTP